MNKGKKLLYVFHQSKGLVALFSVLLSFILIMGSTYAWYTANDQRLNRAKGHDVNRVLAARIEEDFKPVTQWAPGTTEKKIVWVRNTGEVPAIVRLSLEEFFLFFEVDVEDNHRDIPAVTNGNGNLRVYGQPTAAIKLNDLTTWKKGNTYSKNASTYYKAKEDVQTNEYIYNNPSPAMPFEAFNCNFTPNQVFDSTTPPPGGKTDYWYFQGGYFYYSEILDPGEKTTDLLKSISLSSDYLNIHKGALYKLVPEMDAHEVSNALLTEWQLTPGSPVYLMYQGLL